MTEGSTRHGLDAGWYGIFASNASINLIVFSAEKLQAISGPMPAFIRELCTTYLTEGGLIGDTLDWDRSRGGDFRCLATALYVIDKYSMNPKNHGTMSQLEKWLTRSGEPTAEFRDDIHNAFNVLMDLAHDKSLNGVFNTPTKMSPIEFIMISVLVGVSKDQLTPSQLSKAIAQMRTDARKKHVDIRMNHRVGRTMLDFIKEFKASKAKGRDDGQSAASLAKAGKKRKRPEPLDVKKPADIAMEPLASSKEVKLPRTRVAPRDSAPTTPNVVSGTSDKPPTNGVPDRLAAIRAAKDKLATKPISLPPVIPAVINTSSSSTQPKPERQSLESGLMARMNSSLSISSNQAAGSSEKGDARLPRSRHTSPRGRSRSRERDREKDRERDRERVNRGRSVSNEPSPRSRRPYDSARDWDHKSHRDRDRKYTGDRRDSKGKRDDYR